MAPLAVSATAFCSISHGYGVKKLDEYLTRKLRFIKYYFFQMLVKEHRGSSNVEENKEESISRVTLMWRAIKLPIYSVALIPITVGSAAAYLQTGQFFGKRYLKLLLSSVLIIAWLNLSNDVYDFETGADKNKKESVVNLISSQTGTHILAWVLLALGFVGLTRVSIEAGSIRSIILLACAIFCGYIYQCPPFRLSYSGLGEPLCFAAFGPFATTAFYLLQSGTSELSISATVISSSILVGFTTSLILFCSHFHQIEDDKAVGKISPLVKLGTEGGANVVKVAVRTLYSLLCVLGLAQILPFQSIVLCALTLPVGNLVVGFVGTNHKDKMKIFMAKYYCVRLHTIFGAALAAGMCPPYRLSYQGLGEPLCFAAFGPFSTVAFYLLQSSSSELPVSRTIMSASILVGFTSSLILFCSHFHQDKSKIFMAKYYWVRLHTIFGLALAAGLGASRMHYGGQLQSLS
ncbi:UbiA prenyltransferase family protein, partial [Striga asiatica]